MLLSSAGQTFFQHAATTWSLPALVLFPRNITRRPGFGKTSQGGFNLTVLFSYVLLSITELQIICSSKGQNPFFFFQEELIQNCYSSPIIVLSIVLYRIFTGSSKCHKAPIILDKYNIQAIAPDARTFARNVNQTFAEPQNMGDHI